MLKRYMCFLLAIMLVMSILPLTALAEDVQGTLQAYPVTDPTVKNVAPEELQFQVVELEEPLPHTDLPHRLPTKGESQNLPYYGRTALQALRQDFVTVYDRMLYALQTSDYDETLMIDINDLEQPFTQKELYTTIDTFCRDHPEYFWISGEYRIYTSGGEMCAFKLTMDMTKAERNQAVRDVEAIAEQILAGISEKMSDYQKELYIHDTLAQHITYVNTDNAHNIYGGLVQGEAVCDGYAKSFQYLLRKAGIQSYIAVGDGGGAHAWNYVCVDGKYYQTDLTWNDQGEDLYHAYFNLTDTRMGEDHTVDSELYTLPVCNSQDAFYFNGKPEYLDVYTTDSVGRIFVDQGLKIRVYVPGDINSFITWYKQNIVPIAVMAGVNGAFGYCYGWLGHELILQIITDNPAAVVNGETVTQYSTLTGAIDACPTGAYVRLLADGTISGILSKDLYIDLCGYNLSGTVDLNGYTVYGMDTATNGYSCVDMGYFNCTDQLGKAVSPVLVTQTADCMRYLSVKTDQGFSFHRFYLGITHVRLAPNVTGFGYQAEFYGDHMVRSQISSVGCRLWISEKYVASRSVSFQNSLILLLRNIDATNYGDTPINASAFVTLSNGTVIEGATTSCTLRQAVQAVNDAYSTYTSEQLSAVKAMVKKHTIMKSWGIDRLL